MAETYFLLIGLISAGIWVGIGFAVYKLAMMYWRGGYELQVKYTRILHAYRLKILYNELKEKKIDVAELLTDSYELNQKKTRVSLKDIDKEVKTDLEEFTEKKGSKKNS